MRKNKQLKEKVKIQMQIILKKRPIFLFHSILCGTMRIWRCKLIHIYGNAILCCVNFYYFLWWLLSTYSTFKLQSFCFSFSIFIRESGVSCWSIHHLNSPFCWKYQNSHNDKIQRDSYGEKNRTNIQQTLTFLPRCL